MMIHFSDLPGGFVGRVSELAHVAESLAKQRLVTLTGVGGVGKSRLALHGADRVGLDSGRAVVWVDLWPLQNDKLLVPSVAHAFGFANHTVVDTLDALARWLKDQHVLLVLDSCEHLLSGCRTLVGRLLEAAPNLAVLTTSREPLGLAGEHVVEVLPLPATTDGANLLRARAAALGVPLHSTVDQATVVRLCLRLEGIPLAIELAAGQLANQSIHDVDRHLYSRLQLAADCPDGPSRHRTLRTTIGWSHELCEPAERLLWARLSVFRSEVDREAVRRVCAHGPLSEDQLDSALAGLERKSILQRPGNRYRLLDTVREYGHMWLDELGETAALSYRHAHYFLDQACQADAGWWGPHQTGWYRRLENTHADLRAALDYFLATNSGAAVEMCGRLAFFWSCCGHLQVAGEYLEAALARCAAPRQIRARALWGLGVARVLSGDSGAARVLADSAVQEAACINDADGVLRSAYLLSLIHLLAGQPQAAQDAVDVALMQSPRTPHTAPGTVLCRIARVFALTGQGLLDRARAEAEDLLTECTAREEWWARSYSAYQLAAIALFQGRVREASAHARSMLEGKRRIGDRFGLALGLDLLAAALAAEGAIEQAAAAGATAEVLWSSVGHPKRGTPGEGQLRAQCERLVRTELGDERHEAVIAHAVALGPDTVLKNLLG
ncbi:ATP-binding protein [Streptomyces sp. NPDC056462]|uniref:ATP-binding protein n=1 Tax=Streptomyces sp. NPDC056462 TaxID=3345826 RepID=UPI00369EAD12